MSERSDQGNIKGFGHQVEIDNAFSVCYKVTSKVPKGVRFRLFCIAESVGIGL